MSKLHVDIDSSPTEIRMTREFNAPRRIVLKAMTTPELVKKWMGAKRGTVTESVHELRPGGSYRNAFRTNEGFEFFFSGTYHEVSDERVVFTERFNGDPNAESRITLTLVEANGKTTMTMVMAFATQELRDTVVKTGMADGAGEAYDELDALLANL